MNIKTTHSLGDTLWFMADNRPKEGVVSGIRLAVGYKPGEWALTNEPEVTEFYDIEANNKSVGTFRIEELFASKEAMLASL